MQGLVAALSIQLDLGFDVDLNMQKMDLYTNIFKRWIHVDC